MIEPVSENAGKHHVLLQVPEPILPLEFSGVVYHHPSFLATGIQIKVRIRQTIPNVQAWPPISMYGPKLQASRSIHVCIASGRVYDFISGSRMRSRIIPMANTPVE